MWNPQLNSKTGNLTSEKKKKKSYLLFYNAVDIRNQEETVLHPYPFVTVLNVSFSHLVYEEVSKISIFLYQSAPSVATINIALILHKVSCKTHPQNSFNLPIQILTDIASSGGTSGALMCFKSSSCTWSFRKTLCFHL